MPPLAAAFLLARLLQPAAGWLYAESVSDPANAQNVTCSLHNEFLCSDSPFVERPCEQFGSTNWTLPILYKYLEAAIAVEFFTIPLYLTAGYSLHETQQVIFGDAGYKNAVKVQAKGAYLNSTSNTRVNITNAFTPYELIHATFIDEMFHLNWILNVASAAGLPNTSFESALKEPDFTNGAYLDTLPVKLSSKELGYEGSGALDSVIATMLAIETPDKVDTNPDFVYGVPPSPPGSAADCGHCPKVEDCPKDADCDFRLKAGAYASISDFYYALWEGLIALKSEIQWPKDGDRQALFGDHAGQNLLAVTDLTTALGNILAIVYEGEGADARIMGSAHVLTTRGVLPEEYIADKKDIASKVNKENVHAYTHYDRFLAISESSKTTLKNVSRPLNQYPCNLGKHGDGGCGRETILANKKQHEQYRLLLKDIVDAYTIKTENDLAPLFGPKAGTLSHHMFGASPEELEAGPMPKGSKTSCPYANPWW